MQVMVCALRLKDTLKGAPSDVGETANIAAGSIAARFLLQCWHRFGVFRAIWLPVLQEITPTRVTLAIMASIICVQKKVMSAAAPFSDSQLIVSSIAAH